MDKWSENAPPAAVFLPQVTKDGAVVLWHDDEVSGIMDRIQPLVRLGCCQSTGLFPQAADVKTAKIFGQENGT